jgi:hypothetical protein
LRNEYEVRGDVTAIFLNSRKHGRTETLIATSDLERAKEFRGTWYAQYRKGTKESPYVRGDMWIVEGERKSTLLHRWILGVTDPMKQVDHVLHDTLDNCRWALNIVTSLENNQNQRKYRNNTSGYTGVSWHKQQKNWHAHININGRSKHLGTYDKIEEALAARKDAELTYFEYRNGL